MSQSVLNRTPSYTSCYSAVATTMPISSLTRYGSIENLLHGHSKVNPANIHVLIRKNFQPFARAHIAVTKGKRKYLDLSSRLFPGIMPRCFFLFIFVLLNDTRMD